MYRPVRSTLGENEISLGTWLIERRRGTQQTRAAGPNAEYLEIHSVSVSRTQSSSYLLCATNMVSPPFDAAFQFASHVIAQTDLDLFSSATVPCCSLLSLRKTTGCPFVNAVAFPIDKQIPMLAPVPIASTNPARIGLAGINMTSYLDQTPALSSLLSFKLGGDLSNSMRGRTGYIFELPKDTEELNPMVSKMAPGSGVKGHMLIVLVDDDGFQVDATHADIRPICIGAARQSRFLVPVIHAMQPGSFVLILLSHVP
ncbi:hypothetical protein CC1G_10344 [Coprinopsis cinerea okayama7|uniref:Uncharacterized protein n=1 Tax=Coprinopsis cinerea (strain Okayama-7 / 130 / ATCC MYA-4618 / FGSC 9003) TaxID=240176 RepID=A8PE59_COPC7|nr:hypothetical protein CC1G_10344 [Coprinopsis cinerea okayama7\|eukprot:XP_001840730.2 hypothetical protein CC1G_10344 [Coprinopsis cinerea okayama7\